MRKKRERAGHKPGSVEDGHLSGPLVSERLKRTDAESGRAAHALSGPCSSRGLPGQGLSALPVGSYPTVAPLPVPHSRAAIGGLHFCGAILAVARTGRYPATCPVEPGLSSGARTRPRPSVQLFPPWYYATIARFIRLHSRRQSPH